MTRYRTKDGDVLDRLCWKHYGRRTGAVEAVLAANPGLADLMTPTFAAGVIIELPDLPPAPRRSVISLWD
ncbi:MAG: tail protein X [Alphaproteobacteria bacterium]|nr:tail protein X [Alphaproteobacteria bacterium]